jgi:hypothetical protein
MQKQARGKPRIFRNDSTIGPIKEDADYVFKLLRASHSFKLRSFDPTTYPAVLIVKVFDFCEWFAS